MNSGSSLLLSRRGFLAAASGAAMSLPIRPARGSAIDERTLRAAPSQARLTGPGGPSTPTWAYSDTIPGPVLRLRQGRPVRITVENGLAEDTTVHWHGIRLPNAMDGV
ncbi:MAG: multicopper oxidase family protein, partial [Mesorhizobium sp.]